MKLPLYAPAFQFLTPVKQVFDTPGLFFVDLGLNLGPYYSPNQELN